MYKDDFGLTNQACLLLYDKRFYRDLKSGIAIGNLSIQSSHGDFCGHLMLRRDFHTALLHLKPDPNAICHTRSPLFTRPFASMYASSYHSELLDVLPNLCHPLNGRLSKQIAPKFEKIIRMTDVKEVHFVIDHLIHISEWLDR